MAASEFFQNAFSKAKEGANKASIKTKNIAAKTKLKSKISSENNSIEKAYKEIGKFFYENQPAEIPADIAPVFEAIATSFANIDSYNAEIEAVDEADAAGVAYGAEIPEEEVPAEEAPAEAPAEEAAPSEE